MLITALISINCIAENKNPEELLAIFFPDNLNSFCDNMRTELFLNYNYHKIKDNLYFRDIFIAFDVVFNICEEIQLSETNIATSIKHRIKKAFTDTDISEMLALSNKTNLFGANESSEHISTSIKSLSSTNPYMVNRALTNFATLENIIESEILVFSDTLFTELPNRLDIISSRFRKTINIVKHDNGDYSITSSHDEFLNNEK